MASVARKRGWPILQFSSRGSGLVGQLRNLAGLGSMVPVGAGAIGLGLLSGSRRRGVNFFTAFFPHLLLSLNGVRLNVIGRENLTATRPAVFIFNHRNQVDPVITASLVRDNWVSVGKRELERDPIAGPLGKLTEMVFIDRDDAASAVESLHQVEERAKRGLSVVIAPEGTRVDTTGVGPFKKGPFRIAMAAGIPIVPIVIRNAEVVAARDSMSANPGTVDVAVFPAISVDDWTVDTLADWPVDELPEWSPQPAKKAPAKKAPGKKAPAKKTAKKPPAPTAKKAAPKAAPAARRPSRPKGGQ
jgi:putative phosphoserine phosphatase/1-acylglycerol-3-phosphate O-acyltransferase